MMERREERESSGMTTFSRKASILMDQFESLDLDIFQLEEEIGKVKTLEIIA